MVLFSTDTRLELLGASGPGCWVGSSYNLQPAMKGGSDGGVPTTAPMAKSISFLGQGKNSTILWLCYCLPFYGGIGRYL